MKLVLIYIFYIYILIKFVQRNKEQSDFSLLFNHFINMSSSTFVLDNGAYTAKVGLASDNAK